MTTNLSGTAVMGMVANNFIRVMHGVDDALRHHPGPVRRRRPTSRARRSAACGSTPRCSRSQHSFIVDNYDCGPIGGTPPGDLIVNGAIAQIFRGTVGTDRRRQRR